MEVPCCGGIENAVKKHCKAAGNLYRVRLLLSPPTEEYLTDFGFFNRLYLQFTLDSELQV